MDTPSYEVSWTDRETNLRETEIAGSQAEAQGLYRQKMADGHTSVVMATSIPAPAEFRYLDEAKARRFGQK